MNSVIATRQFASTLRTLPPSCRGDFALEHIGTYDHKNQELSDGSCELISIGSDDDIKRMIELDTPFYARGNIDSAPVSTPEVSK